MVYICNFISSVCSPDFYFGKGGNCWSKFEFGNCHSNHGDTDHGMRHGIFNKCTEWNYRNQQEKLDIFNSLRACNGSLLALLLQSIADWRSIKGRTD